MASNRARSAVYDRRDDAHDNDDDNSNNNNYYRDSRGRVREIGYDELDKVRERELRIVRRADSEPRALAASASASAPPAPTREREQEYEVRRTRRVYDDTRYDDDEDSYRRDQRGGLVPYNGNREVARYSDKDNSRSRRRRDRNRNRNRSSSSASSDSDSDSSRARRRRRRERRERGGNGNKDKGKDKDKDDSAANSADEGRMFFSGRPRKHANFLEKNFDSSYEGITAAIAGGLIGGMTARRFGGEENSKAKVIAGTLAGAAGFNAVENWYRVFTEVREERKEQKWEEKWGNPAE